jgi:hypothetical protein
VVVTSTVGARAHTDDPTWFRHLIVDLAKSRSHLVGEGTGDDHDIGLTRRGTENDTETILIVTWGGKVHHFDGTAGETEGHGPEGTLTRPIGDLVESCAGDLSASLRNNCYSTSPILNLEERPRLENIQSVLHNTLLALLAGQWHLSALLAGNAHRWWSAGVAVDIVWGRDGAGWLRRRGGDSGDRSVWDESSRWLGCSTQGQLLCGNMKVGMRSSWVVPRSASAAVDLVVANILL